MEDIRYVYDGWNVILELDGRDLTGGAGGGPDGSPDNVVLRKYAWGLDLSGTMQGAGGIGGLLGIHDEAASKNYLVFSDANGNVGQLLDLSDGSLAARYEYDPYGNALFDATDANVSGPYADDNPFRFSTKYHDAETGWYYYGYRYLDTVKGRWTSRDPLEEDEGLGLYEFIRNYPIGMVDPLGLEPLRLYFSAFINIRLGSWFPEPAPFSPWEFQGDLRGFGGGSSRLQSEIEIESTRIGRLGPANGNAKTWSSGSTRRLRSNPSRVETATAVPDWRVLYLDDGNSCTSEIALQASAPYPFIFHLSPSIKYRLLWRLEIPRPGYVTIWLVAEHSMFPDFEGFVNQVGFFQSQTRFAGPSQQNLDWMIRELAGVTIPAETPPGCGCDGK